MNAILKFLTCLIYYVVGQNAYKSLKSEPNLLDELAKMWNTIIALINATTNDDIIKGRNVKSDYLFFDGNLHKVLSCAGLIITPTYANKVSKNDKYRICANHFDYFVSSLGSIFTIHFDWTSIFRGKDENEIETKFLDALKKNQKMTATEWNDFWNNLILKSNKTFAMKPLEVNYICFDEIRAIVATSINDMKLESKLKNSSARERFKVESALDFNKPDFSEIFVIDDETKEYPEEFSIICGFNSFELSGILVNSLELGTDNALNLYDIQDYIFPSTKNSN